MPRKRKKRRSVAPAPGEPAAPPPQASKRKQAPGVVGVLAFVAAALGVAFFVLLRPPLAPIPAPSPDAAEAMEPQVVEAIDDARAAVADEPRAASAWGRLGMVFQAHELFAEAAESYAAARRLDGDDHRWPYLQAQCLKELRELDASADAVAAAVERRPDFAPLFVLEAELQEQANAPQRAAAAYAAALDVDPRCAPAHYGLGRLRLADGELEAAREHLERAAAIAPGAGAVQSTLARLYQRLGDREAALRAAALARELHPEVPLDDPVMAAVAEHAVSVVGLQSRAVEAEARGEPARAESLLRRMIALRPGEADLYYNLGNNLSRQGKLDEAEARYREALSRRPEHVGALINLGNVLGQKGDFDAAERAYRDALAIEPSHAGALGSLANVALSRGDVAGATGYLERAIELDPRRADLHYVLAQVQRSQGGLAAATRSFERALELAPARGDVHLELAVTLAQQGRFADAWSHVDASRRVGVTPPPEFLNALAAQMPEPAPRR